jgi:RNA 2',3'-cyclic 3'-phosphodiesterase
LQSTKQTMDSWRVFCAIEFPPEVVSRAREHIRLLRDRYPRTPASWIRDGNFHLTVKFLGEIPRTKVEKLSRAAQRATAGLSPFKLIVAGSGSFPKHGPAKVLWLGVEDCSGQLEVLQQELERECAEEGFTKEDRAFNPHLTIARLRKTGSPHHPKISGAREPATITGARELATAHRELGFQTVEVLVRELCVIRSELSSAGSKYTVVSRHVLRSEF